MAGRDFFPTPRPQDGTLNFSNASAFSAAVATPPTLLEPTVLLQVLIRLLEGARRPLVFFFLRPANKTVSWSSVLRLPYPLL